MWENTQLLKRPYVEEEDLTHVARMLLYEDRPGNPNFSLKSQALRNSDLNHLFKRSKIMERLSNHYFPPLKFSIPVGRSAPKSFMESLLENLGF